MRLSRTRRRSDPAFTSVVILALESGHKFFEAEDLDEDDLRDAWQDVRERLEAGEVFSFEGQTLPADPAGWYATLVYDRGLTCEQAITYRMRAEGIGAYPGDPFNNQPEAG